MINGGSVIDDWAEFMTASGASPATIRVRTHTIGALTRYAGLTDPLDLTRRHTLSFLARPRKQWTRVTYWRCITAWCLWLTEFDYPHENLLKGMPKPRIPQPLARPIDQDTITALLGSKMARRTKAYVLLALYCGLRVHEIAKVRGEDFQFTEGWLTVAGKGGQTKPVPIHSAILRLSDEMPETGYWFPSRSAPEGHVTAMTVSTTIGNALRAVGSTSTAHQLRDTAATNFQRTNRDIRMTQALLRHSSLQSTMKYCAVSDSELQAAVRAIRYAA